MCQDSPSFSVIDINRRKGVKNMMKKLMSFITALILMSAMCASAFAVEPRANRISPSLEFDGTTANCKVVIISSGDDIDATMELWRGSTLVGSWPGEGTSYVSISGKCNVTKGITYTLKVSGTIGGERIDYDGISRTC